MSNSTSPSVRYVVFHTPGPNWQYGVGFREQTGVREHVEHYLKFHEQGKLELGGPFLVQDAGGMTLAPPGQVWSPPKKSHKRNLSPLQRQTLLCNQVCFSTKSAHG
jgi:hypothetical protein